MTEVYDTLRKLGLSGKYLGFHYLASAISIAVDDENYLLQVTKTLYPTVAKQYNTTWTCIERNIRTVVTVCWKNNRAYLEALAGYPLSGKPGPVDFISIITNYLLRTKTLV